MTPLAPSPYAPVTCLKERDRRSVARHHKVTEMRCQTVYKKLRVKSLVADLLIYQKRSGNIPFQESIGETVIIYIVKYIQILDRGVIGDISHRRRSYLVKDRQGVAHSPVGFPRNHV